MADCLYLIQNRPCGDFEMVRLPWKYLGTSGTAADAFRQVVEIAFRDRAAGCTATIHLIDRANRVSSTCLVRATQAKAEGVSVPAEAHRPRPLAAQPTGQRKQA